MKIKELENVLQKAGIRDAKIKTTGPINKRKVIIYTDHSSPSLILMLSAFAEDSTVELLEIRKHEKICAELSPECGA